MSFLLCLRKKKKNNNVVKYIRNATRTDATMTTTTRRLAGDAVSSKVPQRFCVIIPKPSSWRHTSRSCCNRWRRSRVSHMRSPSFTQYTITPNPSTNSCDSFFNVVEELRVLSSRRRRHPRNKCVKFVSFRTRGILGVYSDACRELKSLHCPKFKQKYTSTYNISY